MNGNLLNDQNSPKPISRRILLKELKDAELSKINDEEKVVDERKFSEQMNQLLKSCRLKRDRSDGLTESVDKSRQIFFINYSIGVKKDEIKHLEESLVREEKLILAAEKNLHSKAEKFDIKLKESDKSAVEAIKRAETETKVRIEKESIIKTLKLETYELSCELVKLKEQVVILESYQKFTEKLFNEFLKNELEKLEKVAESGDFSDDEKKKMKQDLYCNFGAIAEILANIENKNLSLIVKNQEITDTLDDMKVQSTLDQFRLDQEIDLLEESVNICQRSISREKKRAGDFEIKARLFSFGEFNQEDQDRLLYELESAISKTHDAVFSAKTAEQRRNMSGKSNLKSPPNMLVLNQTNQTSLSLLNQLEKRLDALMELKDKIEPQEKYEYMKKVKEREHREKQREMRAQASKKDQNARAERNKKQTQSKKMSNTKLGPKERQHAWKEMKNNLAKEQKAHSNKKKTKVPTNGNGNLINDLSEELSSLNFFFKF